jgi:GNAT superfamily N-acetyltransferase
VSVELRDEPLDGRAGRELLSAFAAQIAELYPGWSPGSGPSAAPEEFEPPAGRSVVAYEDERPLGCGGVKRLEDGSAEIKRLYVAPHARGRGVARSILQWLERAAGESGHAVVRLDTGARQPDALALFRSVGYREIDDYNGNPFASHWLEKALSRPPGGRASAR